MLKEVLHLVCQDIIFCVHCSLVKIKLIFEWLIFQVVPELSTPIALFTYYNPILKRGTDRFMSIVKDTGVHGEIQLKHEYYFIFHDESHCS